VKIFGPREGVQIKFQNLEGFQILGRIFNWTEPTG
jgi:hypothetical protein